MASSLATEPGWITWALRSKALRAGKLEGFGAIGGGGVQGLRVYGLGPYKGRFRVEGSRLRQKGLNLSQNGLKRGRFNLFISQALCASALWVWSWL